MLSISKERLRELLLNAYESGWSGCLELKSEYVDQAMQQFEGTCEHVGSSTLTVAASSFYSTDTTFAPGYYSNFGQTSPIETAWVNNSGEDAF